MLLVAFTLWLGLCSVRGGAAAGFPVVWRAAMCGYTVGIIAISNIDAPQGVFLVAMDRVAAILLGVVCVALVNTTLVRNLSFETVVSGLHHALDRLRSTGQAVRDGAPPPDPLTRVAGAAEVLALTTQISYAATEMPDGLRRITGARTAVAGLLSMISAFGGLALGRARGDVPAQIKTPLDAYIVERTEELTRATAQVEEGLHAFESGSHATAAVRISRHYDVIGAALSASRTVISVGLCALFCVLCGWPGVTTLLVQQAAVTALLGLMPNPSLVSTAFLKAIVLPALLAGVIGYLLLPAVSGFLPFAMAVGPAMFLIALLSRHPRLFAMGPGLMLYFPLLLSPANTEQFSFSGYLNNVMLQVVCVLFVIASFSLILPVSRRRRLFRVAHAIAHDLRRTMRHGRGFESAPRQSLKYDRLAFAKQWLGRPTPVRLAVFSRLYAFAELDTALRRAWTGLDLAVGVTPGLAPEIAAARAALCQTDPALLEQSAQALLNHKESGRPEIIQAVSGMYGAHILLAREARSLLHYGIVRPRR